MKTKPVIALMMFLVILLLTPASARADDAALKKQLVGSWRGPSKQTIVLREDGVMTSSDHRVPTKWNMRDGVFHTKAGENEDFFKIISLTKTKFVIQDMYHGRHTGTWTRISASSSAPAEAGTTGGSVSRSDEGSIPEQLIRDFYASYVTWGSYKRALLSKFLSQPLVNGMIKAEQRDLDVLNPIIPGNDFDKAEVLRTLEVKPLSAELGASCLVTFTRFGEKCSATYHFEKENGQWRISDVVGDGKSYLKALPR